MAVVLLEVERDQLPYAGRVIQRVQEHVGSKYSAELKTPSNTGISATQSRSSPPLDFTSRQPNLTTIQVHPGTL